MAQVAVVTGGGGFVGSELVKQLLEKGYAVRATVRSLSDAAKVDHLRRLAAALPGTLELFEADLLRDGSFDPAVRGASLVFHVASPFQFPEEGVEEKVIAPAVRGTENVLASCARHRDTVKRVVLTSSFAAVSKGADAAKPLSGHLFTEADWNTTSTVENGQGYWVSKTEAERAAWRLAEQHGLSLVTICPNFIMGPVLGPRDDGVSFGFMRDWLEGKASTGALTFSDVRDVARAHVLAAESPSASGRYIVSQRRAAAPRAVAEALRARLPGFEVPDGADCPEAELAETVDNGRVERELGLRHTAVEESLADMARTMLALGLAKARRKEGAGGASGGVGK